MPCSGCDSIFCTARFWTPLYMGQRYVFTPCDMGYADGELMTCMYSVDGEPIDGGGTVFFYCRDAVLNFPLFSYFCSSLVSA
jgi:hypothetical protein